MRLWSLILLVFSVVAPPLAVASPGLTTVEQIRNLTAAEAAGPLPVQLRGVVVDESQPRERALILADETGKSI